MIKNLAIRNVGSRTLLWAALLLGVIAAVLAGVYLKSLDNGAGVSSGATVGVVVASQDVPALTKITEDMIIVKPLPVDAVVPGALQAADEVVGRVTQVDIVAGEQVLPQKVAATGEVAQATYGDNTPLSLLIPDGKRAFSIFTTQVGSVGGLARPGDYVDIMLSGAHSVEGGETFLTPGSACYVLQDVEVLAFGDSVRRSTSGDEAAGLAAAGTAGEAHTATLAVTAEEAWWLAAAQQSVSGDGVGNQLWIALRPFGDHGQSPELPLCGVVPGA